MKPKKIYGVFTYYNGHVRGYTGPEADRLSAPVDTARLNRSGYFSRTHVKVFHSYENASRKRDQINARNQNTAFLIRLSKHNSRIKMDLKVRHAVDRDSRSLSTVKFTVTEENKEPCPA